MLDSIVGVDLSEWCGTGWTGQPNVVQQPDGTIEVREGAYDGNYHFVDGVTGEPRRTRSTRPVTWRRARPPPTPTGSRCTTRARGTAISG